MSNAAIMTVIALSLVLAAFLGYATDRLRLSPLLGFFIGGALMKTVFSTYHVGFLDVSKTVFPEVGYFLLTLGGVLIAFEMGRDVGTVGFNTKLIYIVVVEATVIVSSALLISRTLGFPLMEGLVLATAFLSSSTVTTYRLTSGLALEEVRRIALTITTLEDIALLTFLGLVAGRPENPLVTLILSILFAIIGGFIFRTVFTLLRGKDEYEVIMAFTLTLGYASVTQFFATPYLGAFIAGYFLGGTVGTKVSLDPYAGFIALVYMVSAGFVTPFTGEFRLSVVPLLLLLMVIAFTIRALSVFLASFLIMGSGYYAIVLAGVLTNISELAPLVALTAYKEGVVGEDLALAFTMLPLATIALSTIIFPKIIDFALVTSKRIPLEFPRFVPESLYEAGIKVMVTSAKISIVMLAAVIAAFLLSILNLGFLGIGVLALAGFFLVRLYRKLWTETVYIGELPGITARILVILVSGAVATYMLQETLRAFESLREFSWISVLILYALIISLIVEFVMVARRYAEKAVIKLRPPL